MRSWMSLAVFMIKPSGSETGVGIKAGYSAANLLTISYIACMADLIRSTVTRSSTP